MKTTGSPRRSNNRAPQSPHRLGIHVRTAAGLPEAAAHASAIGCTTFQIMSGNPSAWDPGHLDLELADRFDRECRAAGLEPVFLHAGYLVNLSCRRGVNAAIYKRSIRLLQANIDRAAALGCEYVVVHLGSRKGTGREEALAVLVEAICRLTLPPDGPGAGRLRACDPEGGRGPVLLLENSAGAGDQVGADIEELALVLAAARAGGVSMPLGICLDTAHLWGAGYDLGSAPAVESFVAEFKKQVGWEQVHLVHFNDAVVELGSRKDRHEHPGCGLIPLTGLKAFIRHPLLKHIPMIMETPGKTEPTDEQRMMDLRELAG